MSDYVVFERETGEIVQIHTVYDGRSPELSVLDREAAEEILKRFYPDSERYDVLLVDPVAAGEMFDKRVNLETGELEAICE